MHLMFYLGEDGKRRYTLKKKDPSGKPTMSAHPCRFSPEDPYSRHRVLLKQRFGSLRIQKLDQEGAKKTHDGKDFDLDAVAETAKEAEAAAKIEKEEKLRRQAEARAANPAAFKGKGRSGRGGAGGRGGRGGHGTKGGRVEKSRK